MHPPYRVYVTTAAIFSPCNTNDALPPAWLLHIWSAVCASCCTRCTTQVSHCYWAVLLDTKRRPAHAPASTATPLLQPVLLQHTQGRAQLPLRLLPSRGACRQPCCLASYCQVSCPAASSPPCWHEASLPLPAKHKLHACCCPAAARLLLLVLASARAAGRPQLLFTAGGAHAGAPRTGPCQCPMGRSPWCGCACRGREGSRPQTRPAEAQQQEGTVRALTLS